MVKMLAGEIMIPLEKYPHVSQSHTVREALEAMEKIQIDTGTRKSLARAVLVFDDSYKKLLGVVRRRGFLRGLDPESLEGIMLGSEGRLTHNELVEAIRKRAERPVSDVMYPIEATVDYHDHLVKIIGEIVEHDLTLIPVMRDGEVVGVVRTVDVVARIIGLLSE